MKKKRVENKWMLPAILIVELVLLDKEKVRDLNHVHVNQLGLQEPRISDGNYPFLVWCAKFGRQARETFPNAYLRVGFNTRSNGQCVPPTLEAFSCASYSVLLINI